MGESVGDAEMAPKSKPTIMVPPRGSMGLLFANGFSPGPMTLVSSYFPEQSPFSFSQLLAMASPLTPNPGFLPAYESGKEEKQLQFSDVESMNPLFMVPPGLSPSGLLNSPAYMPPLQSPFGMSHQQALAHVTAQAALSQSFKQMQAEYQHSSSTDFVEAVANPSSSIQTEASTQPTNPLPREQEVVKKESPEASQSEKRSAYSGGDKPASDGYNWRKYGQKHVKASECPRSYYKCTHLNCPVKKKVERSEIIYKGQHNHDPPKPNKRDRDSCVSDRPTNSQVKPVSSSQSQAEAERINEGIMVNSEPANSQVTSQQSSEHHPAAGLSDNMKNSAIVADEADPIEPIAKRRSLDVGQSTPASSHQAASDTKIVLQTRSEVDLLDDGYKWRKYGQKVVKGNPHPRSYYRCTYAGCNVRKHVERASTDPKSVITTYEGKHNHDIPVGRYSSQGATSQQLKTQKHNHLLNKEMDDYVNKEQIPTTLQFKEERIAA